MEGESEAGGGCCCELVLLVGGVCGMLDAFAKLAALVLAAAAALLLLLLSCTAFSCALPGMLVGFWLLLGCTLGKVL